MIDWIRQSGGQSIALLDSFTFEPFCQINLVGGDIRGSIPENIMVKICDFGEVSEDVERIKAKHFKTADLQLKSVHQHY